MKNFLFFDLDGTLADTDRDIREAWKAAIADAGMRCADFDEKFVAGPPFDEMAKMLFPNEYTPELGERFKRSFAHHYDGDGFPNTFEYPGIAEELKALKRMGKRMYIVTNKRYIGAMAMARHFGWDKIFDGLYAGDMYPEGKLRKPALLRRVIGELKAEPSESVLIGDTLLDFEAARENGIESIGVTWGYGKREELDHADKLCSHLPFPL